MIKKLLGPALALAAVFAVPAHAEVVPVSPNGSWHEFDVDELMSAVSGLEWIDFDGEALSFSFTTATATRLTVVDAGFGGDAFQVFDNGVSLGFTSAGTATYPNSIGLDFDAALASGQYGYAFFDLAAGTHTITGLLSTAALDELGNAINATVGGLNVAPVPLPGAALLLLSGGGLMGLFSRRRRHIAA